MSLASSINVDCALKPPGSVSDYKRRDVLSDDIFTTNNGDEVSPLAISSEDNMVLFTDEDHVLQDGLSSENLNDPETSFITNLSEEFANPSEKVAQSFPCGRPFGKRDGSGNDLILSK